MRRTFPSSVLSIVLLLPVHFEVRIFPNCGRSQTSFTPAHVTWEALEVKTHTHTHTHAHARAHTHTHTHTHSVYVMLCLLLFHGNSDSTNAPFIVRCLFWLFSLNSACNCDSYNSGRQKYAVIGSLSGAFCAIGRLCSGRLSWVFEYVKAVFISTALLKVHLRMPY